MRNTKRAVAVLTNFGVAALLLGCGDAAPGPTGLAAPASASFAATTTTISEQWPTTLTVFVSCANGGAGEWIEVSGDLHVVFHTTISSSGNFSTKYHFQPMGISGVGLTTGDIYNATGVTQGQFHTGAPFPITETLINNFRMIGQGPGNNFMVHENFHITFNANGQVTALQSNLKVTCS